MPRKNGRYRVVVNITMINEEEKKKKKKKTTISLVREPAGIVKVR